MKYIMLEMDIVKFTSEDVITSSDRNLSDWEKRQREEELEEDYDEYEGITDPDF